MGLLDKLFGTSSGKTFDAKMKSTVESGTTPKDEDTSIVGIDDKSIKVTITRDGDGCTWAYENDGSVSNAIEQIENIVIGNLIVVPNEDYAENNHDVKKATKLLEKRITMVRRKMINVVQHEGIHAWGILKKTKRGKDIVNLVVLDPRECTPIVDSMSGELGGSVGIGLNPNNEKMEVALIQSGNVLSYDSDGVDSTEEKTFYFTNDDIMVFNVNDRGRFIGVSPVMRVLRYVEIKKSLENILELIVRRFGPQIKVMIGNQDINLMNSEIPDAYARDSDGNPVAQSTARTAYRDAVFTDAETTVKDFADSDKLVQLLEYGNDIETINPSASPFDYARYINLFANQIKVSILGLYIHGRIDITSSTMQEKITRDLKDKAKKESVRILETFNEQYVKDVLKANGLKEDIVKFGFEPIDKVEEEDDVMIEWRKSQTVSNYVKSGFKDIPKYLKEKWNITTAEGFESPIKTGKEANPSMKQPVKEKEKEPPLEEV